MECKVIIGKRRFPLFPIIIIVPFIGPSRVESIFANLEKPKQRYIRLLENALFGFGLSKLGIYRLICFEKL